MQLLQKIGLFAAVLGLLTGSALASLASDSRLGPTAQFTANPTSALTGNSVQFDASTSRDSRGSTALEYRWDFESKYKWTVWSNQAKTRYTFTDDGNETVRLQVRDQDGLIDETKLTISVQQKLAAFAPLANISVDSSEGDTNTVFHFTVEAISRMNTPSYLLEVRWDWDNDGAWDTSWSQAREFDHTFDSTGYKEVRLEIRDTDDSSSIERGIYMGDKENSTIREKEIGLVHVTGTDAPRASFQTWPVEIDIGTNVHFDASESLRANAFRWDFDGDGTFETGWMDESKSQRVYNSVGVFDATLEVRNSAGKIDRTERTITVIDSTNISPEARLAIRNKTNTAATKYHGVLRDEFSFSASGSRDRDGSDSKMQYRWDFEGDGEWDSTFASDRIVIHRYLNVGTFNPRVEVLDEKGGRATTSEQVWIVANTGPTASLKVKPYLGTRNTKFSFDASESTDDQSGTRYLEYRFDFDGDGIFDTQFQNNAHERFEFDRAGAFTALVEVRDHANAISQATAEFEVADPVPPVAAFIVDPLVGTFQTRFQFDASLTHDPSGVGGPLKYRWDFDSNSASDINFDTGWLSQPQTSHNYREVGQHKVCLTAKNQADHESVFCRFVEIHQASSYLKFLRQKGIMSEEKPDQLIGRAELAKIIIQASKIRTRSQRQQLFTDVAPRDWYAPYVAAVHERGWISPKENFSWDPQGTVNRAEAVKIVFSALYPRVVNLDKVLLRDVPPGSWYARFANKAYEDGLIEIENKLFHPAQPVTRGEIAKMVAILLEKYPPELRSSAYFWVEEGSLHASAKATFRPREFISSLLDYLGVKVD